MGSGQERGHPVNSETSLASSSASPADSPPPESWPPESCPVAIVGAGPAGLAAAEILGEAGLSVALFDAMARPGRKFLMAGRGGLNLTHSEPLEPFLERYGSARAFLEPMIRDFPPETLRNWAEGLGEPCFVGSSGRVFPRSMKASPLLRAWLRRLQGLGVRGWSGWRWIGWTGEGSLQFRNAAGDLAAVRADRTLLALGGGSWPKLGSDGGWTSLLAVKGVEMLLLRPANCGFLCGWSDFLTRKFAGTPLKDVALRVYSPEGAEIACGRGDMILSESGIEGSAVYAIAAPLRDRLANGAVSPGRPVLSLDLRPDQSEQDLAARLAKAPSGESLSGSLKKRLHFPALVSPLLRELAGEDLPKDPRALASLLKALPVPVTAPAGLERAISSAGGVCLSAIGPDLQLKAIPGMYVAGEMLDWEAPTGGYLLQACFATGRHAGKAIVEAVGLQP